MSVYKNIGIYVHIPFCMKKCPYCDFYSIKYDSQSNLEKQYFEALIEEIKIYKKDVKKSKLLIDTIYFGGGTPSVVESNNIKNVLTTIKKTFKLKDTEITLEANPNVIDEKYLIALKKHGVNRLSFGLQSANDDELYLLGRSHKAEDVKEIVEISQKLGFNNISIDLMLGLPNQTIEKVKTSLDFIMGLNIQHISAYILKIEENTLFYKQSVIDKLPDEDKIADIYLYVVNQLNEIGFNQYEISNFAKQGYESKHNLKYWNREEYIGFGPAAHSFYNNKRYSLERNIYKYIGMGKDKKFYYNYDNNKNEINEYIMLKLRTTKGINIKEMLSCYPKIFVDEFLKNIEKHYDKKYIFIDNDNINLKPEGFLIFNMIVPNLFIN